LLDGMDGEIIQASKQLVSLLKNSSADSQKEKKNPQVASFERFLNEEAGLMKATNAILRMTDTLSASVS